MSLDHAAKDGPRELAFASNLRMRSNEPWETLLREPPGREEMAFRAENMDTSGQVQMQEVLWTGRTNKSG